MIDIKQILKYTKNLKLLYVEDNKEAREAIQPVLQNFFDNIEIAYDGQEGLEKFDQANQKHQKFDLVLTDINMPRLNGLEMIESIRKIDSNIPILVLSAYNESEYFMDSIKFGVDGYLLKPIDMKQFLAVLKKIISKLTLTATAQKHLHFLKEYEEVTDQSSIVSKADPQGKITYVNDQFCKISGYTKDELIGKPHNIIKHPDMPKHIFEDMWDTVKNKKSIYKGIIRNLSKDGKNYYIDITVKPILDEVGNIVEYIALSHDITQIMNPKKQLDDAIENAKEPIVIYFKLEDFNTLEEIYDNKTLENIQQKVAKYLELEILKYCKFDKVYQLGNGEYAMTNERSICVEDEELFIQKVEELQQHIQGSIINIDNIEYEISILASIVYSGTQVLESSKLGIRQLLQTKQNFIIANYFAQIEYDKAKENLKTISMVKSALEDGRVVSYFQPIIDNTTQEVIKYESLVRLIDSNDRVLSPYFFLDVSKKSKYYPQITYKVLANSFETLKNTTKEISMNLSALDIEKTTTRYKILELLNEYKEYASRVVFELLEDEAVKDFNTIIQFIQDVKSLGVQIAIDDFGSGYSNFERLLDYQPDILKIDGSLIKNIQTNKYSKSIVETIVAFAKKQKIKTVAEYVENEEIFNILKELGVDFSQGYYFGKPEKLD